MDTTLFIYVIITLIAIHNPPIYNMADLTICSWNMRSLSCAGPYLQWLSKSNDIIFMAEHRLYQHELNKVANVLPGYQYVAKASSDLSCETYVHKTGHC
jgi:hypothetical protein